MNIATQLLPLFLANLGPKARGIFYRVLAAVILILIADYFGAAHTGIPWVSTHVVSAAVLAGVLGLSGVGHVVADKNRPAASVNQPDDSLATTDLEADAQNALDELLSGSGEIIPAPEPPAAAAVVDPGPAAAAESQPAAVTPAAAAAPQVDPTTGLPLPGASS